MQTDQTRRSLTTAKTPGRETDSCPTIFGTEKRNDRQASDTAVMDEQGNSGLAHLIRNMRALASERNQMEMSVHRRVMQIVYSQVWKDVEALVVRRGVRLAARASVLPRKMCLSPQRPFGPGSERPAALSKSAFAFF
jgi:hypothetical protein